MFRRQVFVVSSYKADARKTVKLLRRENSALTHSGAKMLILFQALFAHFPPHLKAPHLSEDTRHSFQGKKVAEVVFEPKSSFCSPPEK